MCSFVACPEPAETPGVCSANSTCNDGRDGMLDCQLAPALVRFLHADGIRWLGIDVQGGEERVGEACQVPGGVEGARGGGEEVFWT